MSINIELFGQFNFQVGYDLAGIQCAHLNNVLQQYQDQKTWMTDPIGRAKVLNGIQAGIRYQKGDLAVLGTWRNKLARIKGEGIDPISNTSTSKELFYKLQSFMFGIETRNYWLGVGASIDYTLLGMKDRTSGDNSKIRVLNDHSWGSHFMLNFNMPTNGNLGICFQLYYATQWRFFDIKPLADHLNIAILPSNTQEKIDQFGVSIIFNNGPQ